MMRGIKSFHHIVCAPCFQAYFSLCSILKEINNIDKRATSLIMLTGVQLIFFVGGGGRRAGVGG